MGRQKIHSWGDNFVFLWESISIQKNVESDHNFRFCFCYEKIFICYLSKNIVIFDFFNCQKTIIFFISENFFQFVSKWSFLLHFFVVTVLQLLLYARLCRMKRHLVALPQNKNEKKWLYWSYIKTSLCSDFVFAAELQRLVLRGKAACTKAIAAELQQKNRVNKCNLIQLYFFLFICTDTS